MMVRGLRQVDQADTTQDSLARSIASVYKIKYGFHGSIVSTLVGQFQKMDFAEMVDDVNEDVSLAHSPA